MQLVVHGGMQKAGSSAVQAYLEGCREELRAIGIDYPDFGHRAHWMVTAALVPRPERYHHVRRRKLNGVGEHTAFVRSDLAERLRGERGDADVLLLSHEDLSVACNVERLLRFVAERAEAVPLRLIAYIREASAMYPSAIQQALKSDRARSFLPSTWRHPHPHRALQLAELLGNRATLRLFAPGNVAGWDVVEDFRAACSRMIDRELPAQRGAEEVNSSLSAEACAVLEAGRQEAANGRPLRHLAQLCRSYDAGVPGTKLRLPAGWEADVTATNAETWNAALPLLDCSQEAREAAQAAALSTGTAYSDADIVTWLLSGLDRMWCVGFADYCRRSSAPEEPGREVADWLEGPVLRRCVQAEAAS